MFTGQQNETLCKNYISELKDLRLRIEDCEAGTVARIRKPVEKEPLKECIQKTTEQKVQSSNFVLCRNGNEASNETKNSCAVVKRRIGLLDS